MKKKCFVFAAVLIHHYSFGQYVYYAKEKSKEVQRIWYLKDYGIKPNSNICYSAIIQKIVDSASHLTGKTILMLPDTGTYHYSLYHNEKKKGFIEIISPIGEVKCAKCEIKKLGYE